MKPSAAMAQFVQWAMQEGPWEGCGLDGGSVQDKAHELGLIVSVPYDPKKHGEHTELESGDPYFILSPSVRSALRR